MQDPRRRTRAIFSSLITLGLGLALAAPARAFEDVEVRAMALNEVTPERFPGAPGVWMGIDREIEVDGMGNAVVIEHRVARVFDPEWARRTFAPWRIPYWSATQGVRPERLRIWKDPDTAVDLQPAALEDAGDPRVRDFRPYLALRGIAITFPEVEPGDLIEIRYRHVNNVIGGEMNVRWGRIDFGAPEPVVEQQLSLKVPDALEVRFEAVGKELLRQRKALGEFKQWTWTSGNLPGRPGAWVDEIFSRYPATAAPGDSAFPFVLWSTVADWKYLSDYYGRRWEGLAAERDAGMGLQLSKLSGKDDPPRERAEKIARYVQEEIETLDLSFEFLGLRPLEAGEIFRAGAACPRDKCLLLYSFLRAAGYKATPAMITTDVRPGSAELPCPSNTPRFMLRILMDEAEPLWLDPLETKSPLPPGQAVLFPPRAEQDPSPVVPFPGR